MKVGIIGYGSMGKMLVDQFASSGKLKNGFLLVSNRTKEKLKTLPFSETRIDPMLQGGSYLFNNPFQIPRFYAKKNDIRQAGKFPVVIARICSGWQCFQLLLRPVGDQKESVF